MGSTRFDRRKFLAGALASAALAGCQKASEPSSPETPKKAPKKAARPAERTVVLGFDGVDPRLVERWIGTGDLPHMAALAKAGSFGPLASTSPPNSPVAWTTFATGLDPSEHGVFGFLKRDPKNYLPGTAPFTIKAPRFTDAGLRLPQVIAHRKGTAWWDRLDRAAVPVSLLFVPYAFPLPTLNHGRVLAGLGAPDGRFTNSSFTLYTTEPGDSDRVAGGRIVRLKPSGSKIETRLEGPRGPNKQYLSVPLTLELNRAAGTIAIALGSKREVVAQGARSVWFPVRMSADGFALNGRVRFHAIAIEKELKLYCSPIQLDPGQKMMPLGAPVTWATEAVAQHALPTVGWVHDTSAVNAGALPKEVFLGAVLDTMRARAGLLEQELAAGRPGTLCSVFTGTDRAGHIFYRDLQRGDGGPLKTVYREMDGIIGRVRKQIKPGTRLIVMSDHGFHPFDHMLHVNTWLEQEGLFTRKAPDGQVKFLRGVDWAKTSAYAMGNGQVYVNQKGREGQGSIAPGPKREALLSTIHEKLLKLRDPATGQSLVRNVYPVTEKAAADLRERSPDLQIAFAPGWRSSWDTSLGGAPHGAITAPNPKAWNGDHAASDVAETPGILLSDQKPSKADAGLKDLTASLIALGGLSPEGSGRVLWV